MSVSDIIKNRRNELNLTFEQIGDYVGVSKSTVKKWETGYIQNIRRDKIAKLADILQINPLILINGKLETKSEITVLDQSFMRSIPTFNSVSAGFGATAIDEIVDYTPIYIKCDYEADNTICINVVGDSMFPKIEEGDKIQVLKQTSVDSGQIAVALIDGEEAVVKKVVYGPTWIELISFNPMYPVRRFDGADVQRVQILGLVKSVIKNFV